MWHLAGYLSSDNSLNRPTIKSPSAPLYQRGIQGDLALRFGLPQDLDINAKVSKRGQEVPDHRRGFYSRPSRWRYSGSQAASRPNSTDRSGAKRSWASPVSGTVATMASRTKAS